MNKSPRICISAGHGKGSRGAGTDPGADVLGAGTEADYTLALAKHLDADFARIFAGHPGAYHMLRDAGPYYTAEDDAAKHACDVFIELHTNAAGVSKKQDKRTIGAEVLYRDGKDAAFARGLCEDIAKAADIRDRGAKKRTDLAVLNPHPGMVQALAELFFGSDADDVAHYNAHRDAVELAIVNRCLGHWGWRKVTKLPRTWGAASRAFYRIMWAK